MQSPCVNKSNHMPNDITLCLTIGNRPEPLEKTLLSLLPRIDFKHIIAINDFRDAPTNEMFMKICPQGTLINLSTQVGHHQAVDAMYNLVKTKYIFHCEDDWMFDGEIPVQEILKLLDSQPELSESLPAQSRRHSHVRRRQIQNPDMRSSRSALQQT